MRYQARAPLRIDLAGGWTDVPRYADTEGGAVLSAAITRYVHGSIARPRAEGLLHALRGDRSYLEYTLDLPSGAGLGASAAQTLLWVTLVKTSIANVSDRRELAEIACRVSADLGILGGKQDEYASALGGINYFTFTNTVEVERLDLPGSLAEELRSRLVLVYTGAQRLSSDVHQTVWACYDAGEPEVVGALAALKRVAGDMKEALRAGDFGALGELLAENWAAQKSLHPSVETPALRDIFAIALANGAVAGKACGAGGGGCAVFLAGESSAERLRRALADSGARPIDFGFDTYGVFLSKG